MQRAYGGNVQGTTPAMPGNLQVGYPKDSGGSTSPGYWWYYMVTESLMNLLSAAGITPSASDMTQVTQAVVSLAKSNSVTGAMKPVRVIDTSGSLAYSGAQVIDGVTLVNGDRVLRNAPGNVPVNDGIWVVNTGGAWTRATDMAAGATIQEATMISVSEGSAGNVGTIWTLNSVSGEVVTVGTTAFSFTNITASTQAMFASYLTTSSAASTYLTQASASSTYQTIAGMSSYYNQTASDGRYLKITDAQANYALISSLASYATVSSLSNYVTNSSLTSTLSNYLTSSTASSTYLTQSSASSTYQTISGMSVYDTISARNTALGSYATVSSLSAYVTNSSLTSTLSSYVTSSSLSSTLSSYVTNSSLTSTLGSYLTTSSASSTYQTISGMSSYATVSSLSAYVTNSSLSSTLSSYATLSYVQGNPQMNSLGVGTPASGTAGEIRATGNITGSYSDERLKQRLADLDGPQALEMIRGLDVFFYRPNDYALSLGVPDVIDLGMSTQQHEKVGLDMLVAEAGLQHPEGRRDPVPLKTLRYERDVAVLMAVVKHQDKQIDKLTAQVERLISSQRSRSVQHPRET